MGQQHADAEQQTNVGQQEDQVEAENPTVQMSKKKRKGFWNVDVQG